MSPAAHFLNNAFKTITKKKSSKSQLNLKRCLTVFDLTALGVGSTLGAGIYVVTGQVAQTTAGPAVVISFFIAAVASVMAGLCYAEFGARVPGSGSGYVYAYVAVGELMAFITGWNLILSYVIGTSSVARALSSNIDSLASGHLSQFFTKHLSMTTSPSGSDFGLAQYFDPFAGGIILLLAIILSIGARESSIVNNIFVGINLYVVVYVVICACFRLELKHWMIDPKALSNATMQTYNVGAGGFLPFGITGVVSGAGTCFYAFVGFDCIATTGEEAKNPQRAIPLATAACLFICFLAYGSISASLTLICPYYLLDANAPISEAFMRLGWFVARYIVSIGALCGLFASIFGSMFPMPRIVYSMANDGLLFSPLAKVGKSGTPFVATLVTGFLAAIISALLNLEALLNLMSIGTLMAYTLVAVSVLLLRYKAEKVDGDVIEPAQSIWFLICSNRSEDCLPLTDMDSANITQTHSSFSLKHLLFSFFGLPRRQENSNELTQFISSSLIALFIIIMMLLSLLLIWIKYFFEIWYLSLFSILTLSLLIIVVALWRQPTNKESLSFKVPLLPILPCLSMFINVHLMMTMPLDTWKLFSVWLAAGALIYFGYGIRHSAEKPSVKFTLESNKIA